MHLALVDWLIVAALILGALYLGFRQPARIEWVDYFLARNKISTRFTLSNYFGANLAFTSIFIVLSLEGARRGWVVLFVPGAWLLGTFFLILIYHKLAPFFEKGLTLHQALGSLYDKGRGNKGWGVQRWASLWTIVAFIGTVALEFYGGVLLLEWAGVSQLTRYALAILLAFACTVFTIRGGLRGIGYVNAWLDGFSLLGILLLVIFIGIAVSSSTPQAPAPGVAASLPTASDNISFAIGSIFLFFPFQICALDTWQRGVAWKKRRYVAWPLLLGGLGIAGASGIAIWGGRYLMKHGLYRDDEIPLFSLLSALHIPHFFIGIVFAGFIAAILSTADELLNCCGYAVLADFYQLPRKVDSIETHQKYIKSGKLYIGIFAIVAALIAWGILVRDKSIPAFFTAIISTQVVFTFPILFGLFSKHVDRLGGTAKNAMILSFAASTGLAGYGLYLLLRKEDGQPMIDFAPILAAFVAFIVMLIGVFVRPRSTKVEKGGDVA